MQRFVLSVILLLVAFSSCNDGKTPPRRIKAKQNDDAVGDGAGAVKTYLTAKMSWALAPFTVYRDHMVNLHLGSLPKDDSGKFSVVLDFVGMRQADGTDVETLLANSGCSSMTGTASKFSADAQQGVLARLSAAYSDMTFLLNDPPPQSGRYIIVSIGGTPTDAGCPSTIGAGVALVNYANLMRAQRAMLFDPPEESPETIDRLSHHIEQIVLVGSGEIDLADDFAVYTGGEVIEPISGEVTSVLLGLGRGVEGLKPHQVANGSALNPELTALLTKRAVPLAGIDRAVTVVAFASSSETAGQISIASAADALSKAANSPAADALSVIGAAAGHPEIALGIELVKTLLGGKGDTGGSPQNPVAVALPRFDELLQVSRDDQGGQGAVTMVEKYKQLKDHIDSHYTGSSHAALRAAALVGCVQALSN